MNFNSINPTEYDEYTFGKCIKARREELGLSIRQLSTLIEISPTYLSDIEQGNRKAPCINKNKKDYMLGFIEHLKIPKDQQQSFYDIAFQNNGRHADIEDYLKNNFYARKALRLAIEKNVSDDVWNTFISQLNKT